MDGDLWGQNALPATAFTSGTPTVVHSSPISNMMFNLYYASTWALLQSAPVALTSQFRLEYLYGPKYGDAAFIGSAAQSYDALGIIVPATKVLLTLPFSVSGPDFVGRLNLSNKRGGTPRVHWLEALGLPAGGRQERNLPHGHGAAGSQRPEHEPDRQGQVRGPPVGVRAVHRPDSAEGGRADHDLRDSRRLSSAESAGVGGMRMSEELMLPPRLTSPTCSGSTISFDIQHPYCA